MTVGSPTMTPSAPMGPPNSYSTGAVGISFAGEGEVALEALEALVAVAGEDALRADLLLPSFLAGELFLVVERLRPLVCIVNRYPQIERDVRSYIYMLVGGG